VKLYIIIPDDLKGAYRLPQVAHAVAESFLKWGPSGPLYQGDGVFNVWAADHKTIVIWTLPRDMFKEAVERRMALKLIQECMIWREPDKEDMPQALVIRPGYENEIEYVLEKLTHLIPSDMVLAG